MDNITGIPSSRDELKQLEEKETIDAYNAVRGIFDHALTAHEGDIPNQEERYRVAGIETIGTAVLLSSEHFQLEPTGNSSPDQPQEKKSPGGKRGLPEIHGTSGNNSTLDDFRNLFS